MTPIETIAAAVQKSKNLEDIWQVATMLANELDHPFSNPKPTRHISPPLPYFIPSQENKEMPYIN